MSSGLFDLKARFQMDGDRPASFQDQDDDGRVIECFYIDLIVAPSATGPKPRRVTFWLDDSYEEPLRRATRDRNDLVAEITSYGDFAVVARIETDDEVYAEVGWLSELLKKGHASPTPALRQAVSAIKAN